MNQEAVLQLIQMKKLLSELIKMTSLVDDLLKL